MRRTPFQQFDQYPIRPTRCRGESLGGYVYRYLATNGHRITSEQDEVLNRIFSDNSEVVKKYFTHLQNAMEGIWYIQIESWQQRLKDNERFEKNWRNLGRSKLRFCPDCLKVRSFHINLWDFSSVRACPEHRCLLVSKCTKCQRPFTWRFLLPDFVCLCGQSIADMKTSISDTYWIIVAGIVALSAKEALPDGFIIRCRSFFPTKASILKKSWF